MSPDLSHLDDRAAAAASDLRGRAGRRPVPTFDPDRLPAPSAGGADDGRSGRRLAAIAAAVVLLVGGAVVASQLVGDDGDGDSQVTTTTDRARPFLAGWLPEGFVMAGAFTVDEADPTAEEWFTQLHVYGVDGVPAAGIGLGPRWENLGSASATSVDVDGREVWHLPAPVGQGTWSVVRVGDRTVVAIGAGLDEADRDRLAVEAVVDDGRLIVPASIEERWDLLTVLPDASVAMPATLYRVAASGELHQSTYATASVDGAGGMVTVTSMAAGGDALGAAALLDPTADAVEVADRSGLVGHVPTEAGDSVPDLRYVTWTDGPGQVFSVVGIGVGRDELLRIADGIRPADPDEWAELERETRLGRFADAINYPDHRTIELGVGTFDGGVTWRLVTREPLDGTVDDGAFASTDVLDLTVVAEGERRDSGQTSWEAGAPFGPTVVTESGGRRAAGGLFGPGADSIARIRVEGRDGAEADDATVLEAEGYRGWVVELPDDGLVLVALDGAGAEVGRLVLDAGEGCGDPAIEGGLETCGWGEATPATTQPGG